MATANAIRQLNRKAATVDSLSGNDQRIVDLGKQLAHLIEEYNEDCGAEAPAAIRIKHEKIYDQIEAIQGPITELKANGLEAAAIQLLIGIGYVSCRVEDEELHSDLRKILYSVLNAIECNAGIPPEQLRDYFAADYTDPFESEAAALTVTNQTLPKEKIFEDPGTASSDQKIIDFGNELDVLVKHYNKLDAAQFEDTNRSTTALRERVMDRIEAIQHAISVISATGLEAAAIQLRVLLLFSERGDLRATERLVYSVVRAVERVGGISSDQWAGEYYVPERCNPLQI